MITRLALLKKNSNLCYLCGLFLPSKKPKGCPKKEWRLIKPTKDHIIPKSKNGKSRYQNLMPAHALCNSQKGSEPIVYFRMKHLFFQRFTLFDTSRKIPLKWISDE